MKRHGIKDPELQCGWKGVYSSNGVTAKGTKGGTPAGTWVLDEHIAAAFGTIVLTPLANCKN